jgi:hypothetical protein
MTAKSALYTAVSGDYVLCTNGGYTITLPAPTAGRVVGVKAVTGQTGASPVTISTPSGAILGAGVVAAATTILLGFPGAYVTLQADGTNWHIIDGEQDTGWIAAPLAAGGYSNYGSTFTTCGYRKQGEWVTWRGLLQFSPISSYATWTPITTIPVGFRPAADEIFTTIGSYSGGQLAFRMDATASGTINGAATSGVNWTGAYLSLSGIRYAIA